LKEEKILPEKEKSEGEQATSTRRTNEDHEKSGRAVINASYPSRGHDTYEKGHG